MIRFIRAFVKLAWNILVMSAKRAIEFDRAVRTVWIWALEKGPLEKIIERKHYVETAAMFRNEEDSRFLVPRWLKKDESFWEEVRRRRTSHDR